MRLTTGTAAAFTLLLSVVNCAPCAAQAQGSPNTIGAIFTEVRVEPKQLEKVKVAIRKAVPGSHVRRVVSGADTQDQTLMVMYHPRGNFREAINDYFRALDPMPGVVSTRTRLGLTEKTPDAFPDDRLIGWYFVEFDANVRAERQRGLSAELSQDPDVLEVAKLSTGNYDLVVVYKFDGAHLQSLSTTLDRLKGKIGTNGVKNGGGMTCP